MITARMGFAKRRPKTATAITSLLEGSEFTTTVIFAAEGEPSLLGVITLENALLAVDPVNNKLIPVEAKRY
jgi:predicted aspartyl protease